MASIAGLLFNNFLKRNGKFFLPKINIFTSSGSPDASLPSPLRINKLCYARKKFVELMFEII